MNAETFKNAYLLAMKEQAPWMLKELREANVLEESLSEVTSEAMAVYKRMVAGGTPPDVASESVYATFIEFPPQDIDE